MIGILLPFFIGTIYKGLFMPSNYTLEVYDSYMLAHQAWAEYLKHPGVTAYDTRLLWVYPDGSKTRFTVVRDLEEAHYHAGRHITKVNFHGKIPDNAREYLESLIRKGL